MSITVLRQILMKEAVKKSAGSSGIMTINKNIAKDVEKTLQKYINDALAQGVDLDTLSPDQLKMIVAMNQPKPHRVISPGDPEHAGITEALFGKRGEVVDMTGKKLDSSKPIIGGTQDDTVSGIMSQVDERMTGINKANKKLGELLEEREIIYGKAPKTKDNPKVIEREMFSEANERFNKTDFIADTVTKMWSMEPVAAMKEANKVIKRDGIYKNLTKEQSQKILKDTDDWIFQRDRADRWDYKKNRPYRDDPNFDPDDPSYDPDDGLDYATGGRAGYYTGGITDVEPRLDDIGHGSDSLMARTRLVSPGSQATTSTGLNYLLAEDNDNIRVPFFKGGDAGRRAFLKLMGTLGGGVAALKTGILGLGGGAGKKAATETLKQTAGSGQPPPYFFELVNKIKMSGKQSKVGPQERVNEYSYTGKNGDEYVLTEDISTGDARIVKDKLGGVRVSEDEVVDGIADRSVMEYKSGKGMADEGTKGTPADEYDEYKVEFDQDGTEAGADIIDESVQKEIIEEVGETIIKKADGGRIGFNKGKLAINTGRKFLEKVFGKERFANMIENDPELHRGMLEVVEMFRNKDKEGLKMYMQKFLPHMDDATVEEFIVGTRPDIEGIQGQLLRLGSGRDYAGKIEMIKEADNVRKLDALDVSKMKPNAEGGRIGKWMGGPLGWGKGQLRDLLKYMAKNSKHGKTPSEMLQMVNPKQFNKMLNDPATIGKVTADAPEGIPGIVKEYVKKIKEDRANMVGDLIGTGRKMKRADDNIIKYKTTIIEDMVSKGVDRKTAEDMAETLSKMVADQSGLTKKAVPKITDQGLLEMENIQKNLLTKDRKLQAAGGLTTMLGE